MNRTLTYTITEKEHGLPISKYLKMIGFSSRSLIELKKMQESVLVNGKWEHLNLPLQSGDILTKRISCLSPRQCDTIVRCD